MKRRHFLQSLAAASASLPLVASTSARANESASESAQQSVRGGFALDENRVRFFSRAVKTPFKVMVIADTHLFRDDDGRLYLYYVQFPGFRLSVQPMAGPIEPAGEPREILHPESAWETQAGRVAEGQCEPYLGWYSPGLNKITPSPTLVVAGEMRLPATLHTEITVRRIGVTGSAKL